MRRYFEEVCSHYGDVLTLPEIMQITGLCDNKILRLLKSGEIKSISSVPRYLVPKIYLLKYVASPKYREIRSNLPNFLKALEGFEQWKLKL